MTLTRRRLTLPLLALALAASACGDDDDNRALSYDDTGEELSAICREHDTAAEEEKLTGDVRQDVPVLREITERTEEGIAEVRELDAHEDLAGARDDFVAATQESLERGETLLALATDGDQRGYQRKIREYQLSAGRISARADELASALGAPACGQN